MKRCLNPFVPDEKSGIFHDCGKCLPCKIKRRTAWSLRLLHQYTTTPDATFITLTYDDAHLLRSSSLITHAGTLSRHHLQLFFKRLRRRVAKDGRDYTVKYYGCGEYGDETLRPHYHAIVFGVPYLYMRSVINDVWHHGTRNDVSVVTEARIRYVCGYIEKKLFGEKGERAYRDVEPPFQIGSNGLGVEFALKNMDQILYDGALLVGKKGFEIPKVYLDHMAKVNPDKVVVFSEKKKADAAMFGVEWLLENMPEFGGRNWEQLTEYERDAARQWIRDRNAAYYADLVSGLKHKNLKRGDSI